MDLILRCDPERVGVELSSAAIITEDADKAACHYRMELNSVWGCPTQCGIYNNALCNDRGICSYDFSNNVPKCFCYSNFQGDGCQKVSFFPHFMIFNIQCIIFTDSVHGIISGAFLLSTFRIS